MSTGQSYTAHYNPAEIYRTNSGRDYISEWYSSPPGTPSAIGDDERVAPSILRRNNRRARRRLLALTPDEESTDAISRHEHEDREDREDRAPWRVAAASQVEKLREELLKLRSENEQLKEQLRELTTETVDRREESNDLRRELRKAKSILQRSRKVTIRYRGESIQEFLKDIKTIV